MPELAPAGQRPWFAGSVERQQFVLLALAYIGGKGAEAVLEWMADLGRAADPAREQVMGKAAGQLQAAAVQLGQQPLLRQQLAVAAPALVQRAVAVAGVGAAASQPRAEPLQLLVALRKQLDPLALGLRLRGCYNPACTCLAGASEADMPLKLCAGCKIARCVAPGLCPGSVGACRCYCCPALLAGSHSASPGFCRYCDAACAKAHWKHHKAACKRVSAAAANEAGDQQQE